MSKTQDTGEFTRLAVLSLLKRGSVSGFQFPRKIAEATMGSLTVNESVLYPTLDRMVEQGLIDYERTHIKPGDTPEMARKRRRPYKRRRYLITAKGHQALADEVHDWYSFVGLMTMLLQNN